MAEEANRKPSPPSLDRDEQRQSAGGDPMLELSRIVGFDDTPDDETPAEQDRAGQFDLEDALMAELGDDAQRRAPAAPPMPADAADLSASQARIEDALPDFAGDPAADPADRGTDWARPSEPETPAAIDQPGQPGLEQELAAALGDDGAARADPAAPSRGIKLQSFDSYLRPQATEPEPQPVSQPELEPQPPLQANPVNGSDMPADSQIGGDWDAEMSWDLPAPDLPAPGLTAQGAAPNDAPVPPETAPDPLAAPEPPFAAAADIAPPSHEPLPDDALAADPFASGVDDALFEGQEQPVFTPYLASADTDEGDLQSTFEDVFDAALDDTAPLDAAPEPAPASMPAGDPGLAMPPQPEWQQAPEPVQAPEQQPAQAAPAPGQPADEIDPVDELTAIMEMGLEAPQPAAPEPAQAQPVADAANAQGDERPTPAEDPMLGLDAVFDAAVEQGFSQRLDEFAMRQAAQPDAPAAMPMSVDEPPVVDTIDMDGFSANDAVTPEVSEADAAAVARNGAGRPQAAPDGPDDAKIAAAAAALGATAAAMPAGASAKSRGDADFDDTDFEAELARDMEFVDHDLRSAQAGQPNEFFDDQAFDETTPAEAAAAGKRMGWRGIAVGGVLGVVALAGAGTFFLLDRGGDINAGPVLVEAGEDPVKIVPDDPGGQTVPNQDRAVFDETGGQTPSQPTLVTTAEEPVDIATAPGESLPSALGTGEKSEERLTGGGTEVASAGNEIETITPRRVRTLVVRPDGTLEERAPALAEPRPEEVAGVASATRTADDVAVAPAPIAVPVPEQTGADAGTANGDGSLAERFGGTTPQAAQPDGTPTAPQPQSDLPLVQQRPADQPAAPAPAPAQPAPQQQVAAVPQVTTAPSSGFTVQLAALPSEAEARSTATTLSQRYGNLIAGRGLSIQRAVIEGRGTFYRVRVAADGRADANQLCDNIRSAGGNCFVAR